MSSWGCIIGVILLTLFGFFVIDVLMTMLKGWIERE